MVAIKPSEDRRFIILLVLLTILFLVLPIVNMLKGVIEPDWILTVPPILAFAAIFLSAAYAVSDRKHRFYVAFILAALAITGRVTSAVDPTNDTLFVIRHVFEMLFMGYVGTLVLISVFTGRHVTSNTIAASLCVYLLLAIQFAAAFVVLDTLIPESFDGDFNAQDELLPLYYSFVTITTLGYGDIVPKSPPARMLSAAEAIAGQVYLTVLVARLVGLHISTIRHDRRSDDPSLESEQPH